MASTRTITTGGPRRLPGALVVVCAAAAALTVPVAGSAQVELVGRVVEERGGAAVAGAVVRVEGTQWHVLTRLDGGFRVRVDEGAWRVCATALGYRETCRGAAPGELLTLRLREEPVAVTGLTVVAPLTVPLSRSLTTATVRQAPPLAEADILRAAVLLPGVTQPNDLKGRIHLAGGASDETGIRLDGHPLQDPYHLLGLLGAFNVAALDRADVLIHHLPVERGGWLSGEVDLRTRRGDRHREVVVSLLSSGATIREPSLPAGTDLLVSGRVSYLDRVAAAVSDLPLLGFHDGLVRIGIGETTRLEVLGFTTGDVFRDRELDDLEGYRPLTWGESLLGLTLRRDNGTTAVRGRLSFDRASAGMDQRPVGRQSHLAIRRDWVSAALAVERRGRSWRVTTGAQADVRRHRQEWVAEGLVDEILSPNTPARYRGDDRQVLGGAHIEGELIRGRAAVGLGVRASVPTGGSVALAPRVVGRWAPAAPWVAELAVERRHQYAAELEEPIEGSINPPMMLLDRPRVADIAAASVERQWGHGQTRVEAFAKKYADRPLLSADGEFPTFDRINAAAVGLAVSGTAAAGPGLLQGAYSWQRAREVIDGTASPTSWDAPHTLNLFGVVRLDAWSLSTAYSAHTGRATTPVLARAWTASESFDRRLRPRYIMGERNSARVPSYHRLDLGARYAWAAWGADWTASFQVLNVLARENAIDYEWQSYFVGLGEGLDGRAGRGGIPIVPTLGLEVLW